MIRLRDISNSGLGGQGLDLGWTNVRPFDIGGGKSAAADKAESGQITAL